MSAEINKPNANSGPEHNSQTNRSTEIIDNFQDEETQAKISKLDSLLSKTKLFSQPSKKHQKNISASASKNHRQDNSDSGTSLDDDEIEPEIHFTKTPFYIKFAELRNYQIEGLNWLISLNRNKINGILADEMGLGKTVQTIALLGYLKHFLNISRYHLVICPKSTLSNWYNEFKRWCPSLNAVSLQGTQEERAEIINMIIKPGNFDVLITTFELCIIECKSINRHKYQYIIIDEAHRIKNENSRLSEVVRVFHSNNRLLLTGTPLQNNLHELWALLNFLLPEFFDSSEDFDQWFSDENCLGENQTVIKKLHAVLKPFLLRRLKSEVEKKLPPKKELKLHVPLTEMQREWYRAVLLKDLATLNGQSKEAYKLNNILMQLRKVCNHPYLFEGAEKEPFTTDYHIVENCGKMLLLDKLLVRIKEQGSRVLIFSQMTQMLSILEDYLLWRKYKYCRLDGNTSYADRQEYIADFSRPDSDKFIFLLSTRAGGLGITLTAADVVIMYDSDWNPQMDLQAMDRAHRIGQTKPVKVFRLITENTVEDLIIERAEAKLRLDNIVIQQGRLVDPKANKLGKDEIMTMIRHGAEQIILNCDAAQITDDDIDTILAKAEERSAQFKKKMDEQIKVDSLKFDSEQPVPELKDIYSFEGTDYRNHRFVDPTECIIETRKRERKTVNYEILEETQVLKASIQRPKLPKLPTIFDFQFYPDELSKILDKEQLYHKKIANYRPLILADMSEEEINSAKAERHQILHAEALNEDEEKKRQEMLTQGFATWNKRDFQNFIKANERYGRTDVANIIKSVPSKSEDEVKSYYDVFWKRYTELNEYQKYLQQIERGEAKIQRHYLLIEALEYKIQKYKFPQFEMKLMFVPQKVKYFTENEDRFMLIKLHELGFDNPNLYSIMQSEFRKSSEFRFDWFIKSRTQYELEKRVNTLLNVIEKEYLEAKKNSSSLEGSKTQVK